MGLAANTPGEESTSSSSPTILVVDDQTRNIQMAGGALSSAGYEIIPATSGEQALNRIEARRPNLILLDVLMPDMDGFEVCQRLRSNCETADIPIIFLSAADDKDVIIRALEEGGVDYITKPFSKAELVLRVRNHLELTEARDRMRKLLEMRDEFIGILAHDLKNPLTGIRFSSQLIAEKQDELPPRVQKLFAGIREGADHMFEFIEKFLCDKAEDDSDFAVELEQVNLVGVVTDAARRHQEAAVRKSINIKFEPPRESVLAIADANALGRVLDNLLSNAIKYSDHQQEVRLHVSAEDDCTHLTISDDGPGFTEEDREKLWQRFVRLSAKPTGGETSTGLGLSIVKRYVDLMHGAIELESRSGNGATFCLKFQRKSPGIAASFPGNPTSHGHPHRRRREEHS